MSGPRTMGLVLLLCTVTTGHCAQSAPATASPDAAAAAARARADNKSLLLRRIADLAKHVDGGSRGQSGPRAPEAVSQSTSRNKEAPAAQESRDSRNLKSDSSRDQIIEVFPRDLRKKEKFLKHLTGPLYFSPKCRKTVYRLYHNTRDCTIPAFFKRCARLLTRLAGSPRCTEG